VAVHVYNQGSHGQVIAFIFLGDLLGLQGDMEAQGRATVYAMAGLGVILGILQGSRALRERQSTDSDE
jgi:predicted MFS family arabinose efflux permease